MKYFNRYIFPALVCLIVSFAVFPVQTVQAVNSLASGIFGGGYGSSGVTISTDGHISANGNLIVDGTATIGGVQSVDSINIGGGYGGSGATITSAGAGTFDAALTALSLAIGGGYGSTGVSISSAGALQVDGQTDIAGGAAADGATFFTDGTTDFAGGYGDSGVSISAAGLLQSDNAITALGALVTADYLSVGGGYGSTGITGSAAGALSMDGNLTVGGTITGTMADAELAAIAGLTSAADKAPVFSGSGTAALLTVKSGTWTPTFSSTVNVDGTSNVSGTYQQIGSIVSCSISVTVDPTAATTLTTAEFTLPVASNLASSLTLSGVGIFNASAGAPVIIYSNATTDLGVVSFTSIGTSGQTLRGTFQYSVI